MSTTFEPCANADGGINILKDGVPIWSSCDDAPNDCIDGVYVNHEKWEDAILLCAFMALLETAKINQHNKTCGEFR